MRWMVLLCLLAGCAFTQDGQSGYADHMFDADIEYMRARPLLVHPPGPGWVVVDLTLVDMEIEGAERLLDIEETSDIAPRANDRAIGELAAGLAVTHGGEILARESVPIELGVDASWEFEREIFYVADWSYNFRGRGTAPLVAGFTTRVSGTLKAARASRGWSIQADFVSVQPEFHKFTTSLGMLIHTVDIPNAVETHRVAVETLAPQQTAAFQLGRVSGGERPRMRVLFVRIASDRS